MVAELLDLIGGLESLAKLDLEIILVENGDGELLRKAVDDFAATHEKIKIYHLVEPRLGVVFARNAALEFAAKSDFDGLAFVDDDEMVSPTWISELFAEQQRGEYDIVGGPVRAFARSSGFGFWEALVWKGLLSRYEQVERSCAYKKANAREAEIALSTNNCLINLTFVRNGQLRFNDRYNLTGGEDTRFFRDARRLGATTGWAPKAVVLERIVAERLSPLYQIRRARDHALVSFYDKFENRPGYKWLRVPLSAGSKLLSGSVYLLLAPLTFGATFFDALRAFGEAAGRVQGLMGIKRQHYVRTLGD